MKKALAVISVLLVMLICSGCSFRISSSIDDLISPISPFGDNADIKKAMDDFAKQGYSLKSPNKGKYITAYNFFDIDEDGEDEAIAFYEPSDNLGTVYMTVLKRTDGKWGVIENVKGMGADVSSLDFAELNGNGTDEVIVCWDKISNSTNHELAIYEYNGGKKGELLNCFYSGTTVNNYIAADMKGDSLKELLLFELNSGNYSSSKAELYSFKNNTPRLLGETKLDAHITSYVSLQTEKVGSQTRVYADALGTNGSSMLTELIFWSDNYYSIMSPFYNYSSGISSGTTRSTLVQSRDINGDGRIEIPRDKNIRKLPKTVSCLDWRVYKNTILIHTDYSLSPKSDGYLVIIPDKYIDKIKVNYDSRQRLMTVKSKSDKKEVFEVRSVLKATYSEEEFKDYTVVFSDMGYYYLAKSGNSKDIKITVKELETMIKSTNGEE